ncbi:MAG TPA: ATP synthase F0 subunit B [Candidatus Binatus sp.]|uniref:ATP synthase F0 subunit B n=1 Tax=Candidatus Binatus sp. TaxID=2811406 RepID=UPI002F3F341A
MHIPPNWGTFFALIVSFLVFWFIFSRLFFRPFLNLLAERERRFKDLNDRTEELIRQARVAEEEREAWLAELRKGAIARRETARRKAEEDAAQMMEAAKAEARDTLEQVRVKIETELRAAESELEQMGHSLASELAERVLGRPLNAGAATTTGKNN